METLQLLSSNRSFGGWHRRYQHESEATGSTMTFAVYMPPQANDNNRVPVLYWLSGLTCTDENFMQKAGAQRMAVELGIAIVAPDTSPRGEQVANDEGYDLGQGAGFYVNATQAPWDRHYCMYDYVTSELPALIEANFPVNSRRSISGHSMGGHGALVCALRNPERYLSVSAFSPISQPSQVPWGQKAFTAYLGDHQASWKEYDAAHLLANVTNDSSMIPALVSQGLADEFLQEQLQPEALQDAAKATGYPLTLERHEGYDHSYYFIASFIEQHMEFHSRVLCQS
ncbi:S-formylglutathione hydrolase [Endozoicomonas montiporae]|uniref:S-formylglutathione hydrolase n=2 Tax=Endozoicomonas montiporae TaxID=1027273 RepID=A0A081N5R0_9GAMM|nr:S-formylglutathione hydrolase [Endozoicomonas montiporae]AMO57323.1 S-formylglutathione hydrolase [Endozoicomonas montiporae CL-33]KEQ13783.1 S-formylglutathione hydrolase [Endozoicomonas montiporae]